MTPENLNNSLPALIQKWEDFMNHTAEYRQHQTEKITHIQANLESSSKELLEGMNALKEMILKLPCEAHNQRFIEKMKSIDCHHRFLWGVTLTVLGAIVGAWVSIVTKT